MIRLNDHQMKLVMVVLMVVKVDAQIADDQIVKR